MNDKLEVKKLYFDFTQDERELLEKYISNKYILSPHALKREKENIITLEQIYRVFDDYKIIEWHYKGTNRLLLRGNTDEGGYNVCIVIDINRGQIVTVYDNQVIDGHYTLNRCNYRKNVKIKDYIIE